MSTAIEKHQENLSKFDLVVLALHTLGALVTGIIGFVDVDPDWADLQRIIVVMLVGLWMVGVLIMALIARRLSNQWARAGVLLVGPFIGIVVLVASSTFT